jgi:MerR family copper efflux transcriptional regulator
MPTSIPIACNLDQIQLSDRRVELAALGGVMTAVEAHGLDARLRFPAERRDDLERFVEAESRCCPFFGFRVIAEGDAVELRVAGPEDGEWAVRGLVAGFVAGWGGLV